MKSQDIEQIKGAVCDGIQEGLRKLNARPPNRANASTTPVVSAAVSLDSAKRTQAERDLERVLNLVDDAFGALDSGDTGTASDILDEILDRYSEDDDEDEK